MSDDLIRYGVLIIAALCLAAVYVAGFLGLLPTPFWVSV